MTNSLVSVCVSFGRTMVGIITRPYETYRKTVDHGNVWELMCIGVVLCLYTLSTRLQIAPVVLTYVVAVVLFWVVGTGMGAKGRLHGFMLAWGYTLVPTLIWFWGTTILYFLIPPPRTTSVAGMLFSALYLVFSAILLFWKITLAYLALRFGLKLDLAKISIVCVVVLPILGLYSYWMYRLGIFRIPFI